VAVFHRWKTTLRITLDVDVCFPVNTAVTVGAVLGVGTETKALLLFAMLILLVVSEFIVVRVGSIDDVGVCSVGIDGVNDDSLGVVTVAGFIVIVAAIAVVFVAVTVVVFVVKHDWSPAVGVEFVLYRCCNCCASRLLCRCRRWL
jgi:hypothetical protein